MPQTIVKETVVYTLEELKTKDNAAYEKAVEKVQEWNWQGWEPSLVTEDLVSMIEYQFPLFYLQGGSTRKSGQTLFWDTNPYHAEAKGSVNVQAFLEGKKLRNKYRSLWYALKTYGINLDLAVSFEYGVDSDSQYDLHREVEYIDDIESGSPRYVKIGDQIDALIADIDGYVGEVHDAVIKYLRAEEDYRSSREFAIEEAEALEMVFTEEGAIFHG